MAEKGLDYPIYLYKKDMELPKSGEYYVIAGNGVFFHKEQSFVKGLVRVDKVGFLDDVDPAIELKLPKIPAMILNQALWFFRKIWDSYKSEVNLLLYYSAKLRQYQLWCPEQEVSMASVHYDRADQPPMDERKRDGWRLIGSIHSHCNFQAYHSSTDTHDEEYFDGIHITLGNVDREFPSMSSEIVLRATRLSVEPENCCLGVSRREEVSGKKSTYMNWGKQNYYDVTLPEGQEDDFDDACGQMENDWFPKVTKKQWQSFGNYYKFDDDDDDDGRTKWMFG